MSQLRKYLKFKLIHYFRLWRQQSRLGQCGVNVFIDRNVQLLRYPKNIEIRDNCVLKEGVKICACNQQAKVIIGANTTVGYNTFIFASAGIEIGKDCMIAPFVYIVDSDHAMQLGTPMNKQANITAPITIGDDVWIASNVTILRGVHIADGAVIAANSVVNTDVGQNEIFGGTPAKKIGMRS